MGNERYLLVYDVVHRAPTFCENHPLKKWFLTCVGNVILEMVSWPFSVKVETTKILNKLSYSFTLLGYILYSILSCV